MKHLLLIFLSGFILLSFTADSFKTDQLRYARVRNAYKLKESGMLKTLKDRNIARERLQVYLRGFKSEAELELWGKNLNNDKYQLLKTYEICDKSCDLGPKRQQGDFQVPEGFYHIDRFNPASSYYLSMGINYPNKSDRILGNKSRLGGDIFIHGSCVTIGCVPITDEQIMELYIFCVEAKNNGQQNIPVTIFPARLSDNKQAQVLKNHQK